MANKYPVEIVNEMKNRIQKDLDLSDKETEEMHKHVMKHWNDDSEVSSGKQELWTHALKHKDSMWKNLNRQAMKKW